MIVVYQAAYKCTHHSSYPVRGAPPPPPQSEGHWCRPTRPSRTTTPTAHVLRPLRVLRATPPPRLCSQRIRRRGCRTSSPSWLIPGFSNKLCTSIHVQHLPPWFMAAVPLKNTSLSGYRWCSRVPPKHGRPLTQLSVCEADYSCVFFFPFFFSWLFTVVQRRRCA